MFPGLTGNDHPDVLSCDPVAGRDRAHCLPGDALLADLPHLVRCHFRHAVRLPDQDGMSTPGVSVCSVIRVRPRYQMGRLNAVPDIARMADYQPRRYFADIDFVTQSMRFDGSFLRGDSSISPNLDRAGPDPTGIRIGRRSRHVVIE